ncbi:MbtH family protein [Burkholderia pseudomallei]|uniref:MbtH family protein n=1 Tax=Burkholderia pseudomallei TaxID=28450 RepID=UPI000536FF66|nr:MbtH family NRPS accessory protein [Burkholderia pseudomallei]KGV15323.1 mbtH-like family protein [Burkholderia pseudomallei MSHR4300]OMW58937.1 antibiotic synthesis protein MbtH [Burkholderia pseudomallei]RAQ84569.1 antibiotic synthesis protein MbtH [Burkholderia pseudomallei]
MDDELYFVVRNNEGQYSVWMDGRSLPAGWETVGEPATKQQCLQRIEQLWTDMVPASVRERLNQHSGPGIDYAVR